VLQVPRDLPASSLIEAANYLNSRIRGLTLGQVRSEIEDARKAAQTELDELTARLVDAGLASWGGAGAEHRQLIVRGQANLLEDLTAMADLERIPCCSTISRPRRTSSIFWSAPRPARACGSSSARRTSCSRSPARR
jgi:transcriptional regulator of heat shock response